MHNQFKQFYSRYGQVNWLTTNDATLITGIQFEVGDTATSFEHRSYGDELARCQRYFYNLSDNASQR